MFRCGILRLVLLAIAAVMQPDSANWVTVRQADRHNGPAEVSSISISGDGRHVAFASFAPLVDLDTNRSSDIYVLDRETGAVSIESLSSDTHVSNVSPRISGDGRFVVFERLVPSVAGTSAWRTIALRDRQEGTTRIVSGSNRAPSRDAAISSDGRFVVFSSCSPDLVDGDVNGNGEDVYSYELRSNRLARISLDASGHQLHRGESFAPAASADGQYVAFVSTAPLAGPADGRSATRALANVYLRDTLRATTTRVSIGRGGTPPDAGSYDPAISGDGRLVVFVSEATNLVPGDRNQVADVFLFDAGAGTISLISRGMAGGPANGPSGRPAISGDGQTIVFQSEASDLACADRCTAATRDFNLVHDVFALDRRTATIRCLSCGGHIWMEASAAPATNATGTVVAFSSRHPIGTEDADNDFDLFVRTLERPALTKRH